MPVKIEKYHNIEFDSDTVRYLKYNKFQASNGITIKFGEKDDFKEKTLTINYKNLKKKIDDDKIDDENDDDKNDDDNDDKPKYFQDPKHENIYINIKQLDLEFKDDVCEDAYLLIAAFEELNQVNKKNHIENHIFDIRYIKNSDKQYIKLYVYKHAEEFIKAIDKEQGSISKHSVFKKILENVESEKITFTNTDDLNKVLMIIEDLETRYKNRNFETSKLEEPQSYKFKISKTELDKIDDKIIDYIYRQNGYEYTPDEKQFMKSMANNNHEHEVLIASKYYKIFKQIDMLLNKK